MPNGIAPPTNYRSIAFIRFCPSGQKSISRLKNGAFGNSLTIAGRGFSPAERFLPERQKHMLPRKRSYIAVRQYCDVAFFSFFGSFLSLLLAIKEKEMNMQIICIMYCLYIF